MRSGEAKKSDRRFGFRLCDIPFFRGAQRAIAYLSSVPPALAGVDTRSPLAFYLKIR